MQAAGFWMVTMSENGLDALRVELESKKQELAARLERITANLRRGYEADSKERAKQLEDSEVVDALGNEAREELAKISAALQRMDNGDFGICIVCGAEINIKRLRAYPYADECIDCARFDEHRRARE
ncbi:MAG: TraR/DksA family transcriptional regulator [Gammaproteobacteria bacterium]|nr:TraR/DksA family transcriptional regulator [Gammaproteobacteria bacterium]